MKETEPQMQEEKQKGDTKTKGGKNFKNEQWSVLLNATDQRDRRMFIGLVSQEATDDLSKSNFNKVVGADCSGLRSEQSIENEGYVLKNRVVPFYTRTMNNPKFKSTPYLY